MKGRLLIVSLFLLAGSLSLHAQDHPVSVLDGPVIKTDTVRRKPQLPPLMGYPMLSSVQMPSFLSPDPFETKEQRAARINAMTSASLMASLNYSILVSTSSSFGGSEMGFVYSVPLPFQSLQISPRCRSHDECIQSVHLCLYSWMGAL